MEGLKEHWIFGPGAQTSPTRRVKRALTLLVEFNAWLTLTGNWPWASD